MKKKLIIFIITYKAKHRVYKVFKQINFRDLNKFKTHILISDDCSRDTTVDFSKKIKTEYKNTKLVINKKNLGYGGNIKKCISYAVKKKFDYAVMIHGDGQYSPIYIKKLINSLSEKNFDVATGSRLKKGISKAIFGGMPFYKLLGNIFLTSFFNFVFKTKFKDAHTGMWAYKLNIFKKIKIKSLPNTFNFDQRIRIEIIKKKLKIEEISIKTIYADERSQLHVIYAIKFFFITLFYFLKLDFFLSK